MQARQTHRAKSHNVPKGVALNLLASALTILTAIALLGTAAVLGDTSATVVESERHDRVIHDFYSAVNEAFRSGDSTALDRIVAPNLVFHAPSARMAPNRAGLERFLTSIHDNFPAFQLRVEDIVSDGDRAVARVIGGSETPGGFLGLTFAATPSPWGEFDSFRIADRQIVEIRSSAPAPVQFEPVTEVRLDLDAPPQAIAFARLSASAGERREWGPFSGPRVLYVDEGTIAVDLMPSEPPRDVSMSRNGQVQSTQVASGAPVVVTAGEALSFPPGSRYMVRHDANGAGATAFTVALPRFHYIGPHQPQEPTATGENIEKQADPEVVHSILNGEPELDPLTGVTVALGRAHLPAGASIAFHKADLYAFMVAETGAPVLSNKLEMLSLDRLDADDFGQLQTGEPFALHNLGDDAATVFIVTVLPRNSLTLPAST